MKTFRIKKLKTATKLGIVSVSALTMLAASLSILLTAQAATWSSQIRLHDRDGQVLWSADVKARPDGVAIFTGETASGSGNAGTPSNTLILARSDNPGGAYRILNDTGASNNNNKLPRASARPDNHMALAWRDNAGSGFYGWYSHLDANLNIITESDVGHKWGGGALDQPAIAFSSSTGKTYFSGQFNASGGAPKWYFGESSDEGQSIQNIFNVGDGDRQNGSPDVAPQMCIGPNDTVHVVAQWQFGIAVRSRVNGQWKQLVTLQPGDTDNVYRDDRHKIACGVDGSAYVLWDTFVGGASMALARFDPNTSQWTTLTTNIGNGAYNGTLRGDLTVALDGHVWVALALGRGYALEGLVSGNSIVFNTADTAVTANKEVFAAQIEAGPDGKLHYVGALNNEPNPFDSAYSYTTVGTGKPQNPSNANLSWNPNTSTFTLTWQDNASNEVGYTIERHLVGETNWSVVGTLGVNATTFSENNFFPENVYEFRVKARGATLDSEYATSQPIEVLNAPSNATITEVTSSKITLTWQDNSAREAGYVIERQVSGSNSWGVVGNVGANVTTFTENNFFPELVYQLRVKAKGATSDSSYATSGDAQLLNAPSNLVATSKSSSKITLTWQDNSGSEVGYIIERRANGSSNWESVTTVAANVTTFDNDGLAYNSTYFYRVKTDGTVTDSAFSAEATATTEALSKITVTWPQTTVVDPNKAFAVQPVIKLFDKFNQPISNMSDVVFGTIKSGPTGAGLLGTNGAGDAAKVFANTSTIDYAGRGLYLTQVGFYVIRFTVGTVVVDYPITVQATLKFTTPAPNGSLTHLTEAPFSATVQLVNSQGAPIKAAEYNGAIRLSLQETSVSGDTSLTQSGSSNVTGALIDDSGFINFINLKINKPGSGMRLKAVSTVNPALFGQILSGSINQSATISLVINGSVTINKFLNATVQVLGQGGTVVDYDGPVYITSTDTTNPLVGKTVVYAVDGVATIDEALIESDGLNSLSNYVIKAGVVGLTPTLAPEASQTIGTVAGTTCTGLVVNSTADDTGGENLTNCTGITLRGALGRAGSGSDKQVVIAQSLGANPTITLGSNLTVPQNVSIGAGCGSNGPRLTLTGAATIAFSGTNSLNGVFLDGIHLAVGNSLSSLHITCSKVR